jgi:hypothetical protein
MVKVYFSPGCNSATHMLCRNGIQTAKKQNGGKFHHPACPYHNNKVDIIFPIIFSVAVIRKRTNKGGRVAFFDTLFMAPTHSRRSFYLKEYALWRNNETLYTYPDAGYQLLVLCRGAHPRAISHSPANYHRKR